METIIRNELKNGIEITLDSHATDETLAWFRANSFRWSKRSNIWWRPFSEEMWTKVHEYFKKKDVPAIVAKTTCDICGWTGRPRGLGTHKRMKHGIVVKRVMTVISKQGETVQRSIRPSAYVPVMVKEQTIRIEAAKPIIPDSEYVGRVQCYKCKKWFLPEDTEPTHSNLDKRYTLTECLSCYWGNRTIGSILGSGGHFV